MFKATVLALAAALAMAPAAHAKGKGGSSSGGSHYKSGYVKKDGTYVAPSRATRSSRSSPVATSAICRSSSSSCLLAV